MTNPRDPSSQQVTKTAGRSASPSLTVREVITGYELLELLGQGASGVVYKSSSKVS